jgi:hypothetical protein
MTDNHKRFRPGLGFATSRAVTIALAIAGTAVSAPAQRRLQSAASTDQNDDSQAPYPTEQQRQRHEDADASQAPGQGNNAQSAVGVVGKRQDRNQPVAGIMPMARVNSRIANRVQSRIRNRIDRNYSPGANTASPFEVATDQSEKPTGRR